MSALLVSGDLHLCRPAVAPVTHALRQRVQAVVLVAACFFGIAAHAAEPDVALAPDEVAADPRAAWERFLERATFDTTNPAYDLLATLQYRLDAVDAAACSAHARELTSAVASVPIGIAIRRAAMLCAEATGNEAGAERELAAVAALSKLALSRDAGEVWEKPIRVLRRDDIYALLVGSGLEYRYEYYGAIGANPYFPLVVAAWDDEAKVERHLTFDLIESLHRLGKREDFAGFPIRRRWLVNAIIEEQVKTKDLLGIDIAAVRAAAQVTDAKEKIAKLRPAAEAGGLQSLRIWLLLCSLQPSAGCADGLVDALLPLAEARHALPMTLLAFAYGEGIGLTRDDQASTRLLDAANQRWYRDGATLEYATLWSAAHQGAWPPPLLARLARARSRGNARADAITILRKLGAKDKPALVDSELAFLAEPAKNQLGTGYGLLAEYHEQLQHKAEAAEWIKRAAMAGSPEAQVRYGFLLVNGVADGPGRSEGLRLVEQAARAGNMRAMRYMAYVSGTHAKWADAEAWLLDAVAGGDIDAILEISALREWERPGVREGRALAITTYRALSDQNDVAEARRRLALMAIDGRGMKKDPEQAKRWLLVDAERADHASETMLAGAYLHGLFGAVDEPEGMRWMDRALAAKDTDAYVDYGAWLFYVKDTPQSRLSALELWQKGEAADSSSARNNLAWAWCTTPHADLFDAARGIAMAQKMMRSDVLPYSLLDTVAACHAAAGEFDRAAVVQQQVIDALPPAKTGEQSLRKPFGDRLALYRAHHRYVEIRKKQ